MRKALAIFGLFAVIMVLVVLASNVLTPPLEVSGFMQPQCFAWPLEKDTRVCLFWGEGLAWIDPEPDKLDVRTCEAWSDWIKLSDQVILRTRPCSFQGKIAYQWDAWAHTFRPPSLEEGFVQAGISTEEMQRTLRAQGAEIAAIQEFLEPLGLSLYGMNFIVPYFEWTCAPWGVGRALPENITVHSRLCQHAKGALWRQWEVQP